MGCQQHHCYYTSQGTLGGEQQHLHWPEIQVEGSGCSVVSVPLSAHSNGAGLPQMTQKMHMWQSLHASHLHLPLDDQGPAVRASAASEHMRAQYARIILLPSNRSPALRGDEGKVKGIVKPFRLLLQQRILLHGVRPW